jgi:NAD(P)H-hydrate repair Nnr-like enzyme with NAD(P)H-hydrate epimerase domain
MYLVTAEQMRQADCMTIQELGIPEMVLMENAGKAVVEFLQETFTDLTKKQSPLWLVQEIMVGMRWLRLAICI